MVTLWYRAPEILLGSTSYGRGVDIFSAGTLFAELISGRPLFKGRTDVEQLSLVFGVLGHPLRGSCAAWPPDTQAAVERFAARAPQSLPHASQAARVDSAEICGEAPSWSALGELMPFGTPAPALDLMSKLMSTNPIQRPSAREALHHPFFWDEPKVATWRAEGATEAVPRMPKGSLPDDPDGADSAEEPMSSPRMISRRASLSAASLSALLDDVEVAHTASSTTLPHPPGSSRPGLPSIAEPLEENSPPRAPSSAPASSLMEKLSIGASGSDENIASAVAAAEAAPTTKSLLSATQRPCFHFSSASGALSLLKEGGTYKLLRPTGAGVGAKASSARPGVRGGNGATSIRKPPAALRGPPSALRPYVVSPMKRHDLKKRGLLQSRF